MQGRISHQPELFATVNLSEMVPKDHLLRKIDKVVNLDFIYDLTADLYCADNGRNSIDPVMYFRMQIIAFLYGIKSDRRLCQEIHLNIAYRWFCRLELSDEVPEHSSLTRIRDRFGEKIFKAIFDRLIRQWAKAGIVKGKRLIADASLVEADADLDSMVERDPDDPEARELKPYQQRYHDFRDGTVKRKISNQTHVSTTDPDAKLVYRRGNYRKLFYKAHYTIDAESRLITDCLATSGNKHECRVLPDRIDRQIQSYGFDVAEVIADKGYGTGPNYSHFRQNKIRTYIPLHADKYGAGRISSGEFRYDRKNDRFRCQAGHWLSTGRKPRNRSVKCYWITKKHCNTCQHKTQCLPESQADRGRLIYRSDHHDELCAVRRRQLTPHFKKKLKERGWKIEGLFGEAKECHNLRRARYRSLSKVQIQFYLTAIVQNFKRVVAMTGGSVSAYLNRIIQILKRCYEKKLKISPLPKYLSISA